MDVDGPHPLRKLSGDFFSMSGATVSYFGSFVVDSPVVTTTATAVVIRGLEKLATIQRDKGDEKTAKSTPKMAHDISAMRSAK